VAPGGRVYAQVPRALAPEPAQPKDEFVLKFVKP